MNTLEHRPRQTLDAFRPSSLSLERERAEGGQVVSVATIFLTNRECPWRCLYCDLWKNTLTETVPAGAIPAQIDYALEQLESACDTKTPKQIKLYNAGSFFDPLAIPPEDFPEIASRVSRFERVIVECHPALIGESALEFRDLLRAAGDRNSPAPTLEIAMGLEIADDEILAKLNKRMTLEMFARAATFLRANGIAMRAFVMIKPPFVRSDDEALHWARRSIDFAFDCGATVVSLIPTRPGTTEMERLARAGEFSLPGLSTLKRALDFGLSRKRGRVFADLWDLDQFTHCAECRTAIRQRLEKMNLRQSNPAGESSESCFECGEALP